MLPNLSKRLVVRMDLTNADLAGLEIEVVVVRFPLIGLALGFLAPKAKAKVRSNLAAELPVLGVIFVS